MVFELERWRLHKARLQHYEGTVWVVVLIPIILLQSWTCCRTTQAFAPTEQTGAKKCSGMELKHDVERSVVWRGTNTCFLQLPPNWFVQRSEAVNLIRGSFSSTNHSLKTKHTLTPCVQLSDVSIYSLTSTQTTGDYQQMVAIWSVRTLDFYFEVTIGCDLFTLSPRGTRRSLEVIKTDASFSDRWRTAACWPPRNDRSAESEFVLLDVFLYKKNCDKLINT